MKANIKILLTMTLLFLSVMVKSQTYCTPNMAPFTIRWIESVSFSDLFKTSYYESYNFNTSEIAHVKQGKTYVFTAEIGQEGLWGWDEFVTVYIDWNGDYVFDEVTERYEIGFCNSDGCIVSREITVPIAASVTGAVRMRVVNSRSNYIENSCMEEFSSGEVEDYNIVIFSKELIASAPYDKYDDLGRLIEQGVLGNSVEKGLLLTMINSASWYDVGADVRKVVVYDLDHLNHSYNTKGLKTQENYSDGGYDVTHYYKYNDYGQVLKDIFTIENKDIGFLKEYEMKYSYKKDGKLSKVSYASGEQYYYYYDQLGRLKSIGNSTDKEAYVRYNYTPGGQVLTTLLGGLENERKYTLQRAVAEQSWKNHSGILYEEQLTYKDSDNYLEGRIVERTQERASFSGPKIQTYSYDDQYQLIGVSNSVVSDPDNVNLLTDFGYIYDGNGNLLRYNFTGEGLDTTYFYTSGRNTQLDVGESNVDYKGKVEVLDTPVFGETELSYDLFSEKVTRFLKPQSNEFVRLVYDGRGRRVMKIRNFAKNGKSYQDTVLYIHGHHGHNGLPVEEQYLGNYVNESGQESINEQYTYLYGIDYSMLSMKNSTTTYYAIKDYQGSICVLYDNNGELQAENQYQPYGKIESSYGENIVLNYPYTDMFNYKYIGQEYDEELGLYNYRARMYDANSKRFLSPDPLHINYSPYVYANNDPINYVDKDGRMPEFIRGQSLVETIDDGAIETYGIKPKYQRLMKLSPVRKYLLWKNRPKVIGNNMKLGNMDTFTKHIDIEKAISNKEGQMYRDFTDIKSDLGKWRKTIREFEVDGFFAKGNVSENLKLQPARVIAGRMDEATYERGYISAVFERNSAKGNPMIGIAAGVDHSEVTFALANPASLVNREYRVPGTVLGGGRRAALEYMSNSIRSGTSDVHFQAVSKQSRGVASRYSTYLRKL